MIEEKLIEYSTAKLAKEKGFNHIKANCFGDNMVYQLPEGILINALNGNTTSGYILAPTQSLLAKWLREVHNIHIEISFGHNEEDTWYDYYIHTIKLGFEDSILYESTAGIMNYEACLEEALIHALNMIK